MPPGALCALKKNHTFMRTAACPHGCTVWNTTCGAMPAKHCKGPKLSASLADHCLAAKDACLADVSCHGVAYSGSGCVTMRCAESSPALGHCVSLPRCHCGPYSHCAARDLHAGLDTQRLKYLAGDVSDVGRVPKDVWSANPHGFGAGNTVPQPGIYQCGISRCVAGRPCVYWHDMERFCSCSTRGTAVAVFFGDAHALANASYPIFIKTRLISRRVGVLLPLNHARHWKPVSEARAMLSWRHVARLTARPRASGEILAARAVRIKAQRHFLEGIVQHRAKIAPPLRAQALGARLRCQIRISVLQHAANPFDRSAAKHVGDPAKQVRAVAPGQRRGNQPQVMPRSCATGPGGTRAQNLPCRRRRWLMASDSLVVMPLDDPNEAPALVSWLDAHITECIEMVRNANAWVAAAEHRQADYVHALMARWRLHQGALSTGSPAMESWAPHAKRTDQYK